MLTCTDILTLFSIGWSCNKHLNSLKIIPAILVIRQNVGKDDHKNINYTYILTMLPTLAVLVFIIFILS